MDRCVSRTRLRNFSFWRVRRIRTVGKLLIIELLTSSVGRKRNADQVSSLIFSRAKSLAYIIRSLFKYFVQSTTGACNSLLDHLVAERERDETGFKLRGRQIDALLQHTPEVTGELRSVRCFRFSIVSYRLWREIQAEHRANADELETQT